MCQRDDCGDPGNTKPWCGLCGGHITEVSSALHNAATHPPDPPPAGLAAG
jgi:hypothetical protein